MVVPLISEDVTVDPSAFLGEYGGYIDELAVVAKAVSGETLYQSSIAPSMLDKENFFERFSNIAKYLDIRTYAVVHAFLDKLFHRKFKSVSLNAEEIPVPETGFICPNKKGYWKYLAEMLVEIAGLQISGIILLDFRFPWRKYCFCTECIRDFRMLEDLPVYFHYELLEERIDLYERWLKWRSKILSDALKYLVNRMSCLGKNVPVIVEVILDPLSEMIDGVFEYFGQDLEELSKLVDGFVLNVFPFSTFDKDAITDDVFTSIISLNKPIYLLYTKNLTKDEFEILKEIAKIVDAKKIFIKFTQIAS